MDGTDIGHAVLLTGVTSLLHFRLGNVDPSLVGYLVLGSIPGGVIGSHLTTRVPVLWLRRILCLVLMPTGARKLWASASMHSHSHLDVLDRINTAIEEAKLVFAKYSSGVIAAEYNAAHDPATQADKELD